MEDRDYNDFTREEYDAYRDAHETVIGGYSVVLEYDPEDCNYLDRE